MLDVDGHVISASDLITRVHNLIQEQAEAFDSLATKPEEPPGTSSTLVDVAPEASRRLRQRLTTSFGTSRAQLRSLAAQVATLQHELNEQVQRHEKTVAGLQNSLDVLRRQNIVLRMQSASALRELALENGKVDESAIPLLRAEVATVLERLGMASGRGAQIDYAGFEDRFRGNTEEVRDNQRRYLDRFPAANSPGMIVDVGCGRGEMLEVLLEAGHAVVGVDTDPNMIKVCEAKGLPVVQQDAMSFLESLAPESVKGVFCAQVVEHMLTHEIERFIQLSYERLRVSGVAVVETINPRSLYALGNHFFADTSHVRPVHPETLRFLCEQTGFSTTLLEECSEHPLANIAREFGEDDLSKSVAALLRVVFGYQDYTIFATK